MTLWTVLAAALLPAQTVVRSYDEAAGLSHNHTTQILQDKDGFIWIATWNGLNRFDGYEFRRMPSPSGYDCTMASDRLRDIWLDGHGDICCREDDGVYRFDLRTYRFRDMADSLELQAAEQQKLKGGGRSRFNGTHFTFDDRQGLTWALLPQAVTCTRTVSQPAMLLPQTAGAQVRLLHRDRQGRIWVATKTPNRVLLFDGALREIGYLSPEGRITATPADWPVPVYSMTQMKDGTVWLGSKPGGLFRLRQQTDGQYRVQHIGGLTCNDVYDLKEDRWGRLWIATMGGGVCCIEQPAAEQPVVRCGLSLHQQGEQQLVRQLSMTLDVLMATTTRGLLVAPLGPDLAKTRFVLHQKEPRRQSSLGCNATMNITVDRRGRLFISTESGGVLQLTSDRLTDDTLTFSHCDTAGAWPSVVALSVTAHGDSLLVVGNSQVMDYDVSSRHLETYDAWFFNHTYHFNEVLPLKTYDGRWLLPTDEGVLCLNCRDMRHDGYVPNIVLTGISIQNQEENLAVNHLDTLTLSPSERSLTIRFAALDFTAPERLRYAFRLGDDGEEWTVLGHEHAVTLLDLNPGTYTLSMVSTNTGGTWVDNVRRLVIIVKPTFWETPWALLLLILIVLSVVATVVYTLFYIRRIKRQRQEMLEAYLSLMDSHAASDDPPAATDASAAPVTADDSEDNAFMQRVVAFVEQHIGDGDISVGDMADACAVSRSGLQRKMKQLVGVTPLDFLREARIKRACQLLRSTGSTVSDVAYQCGFSDPKYFARCFKTSVGMSPTEYRAAKEG